MTVTDAKAHEGPAARHWRRALGEWAIPEEILAAAPEPPWSFSATMFARIAEQALAEERPTSARRAAEEALPAGGTVMDVGVGGGAASLPLAGRAGLLVGVDQGADMLEVFARAAEQAGVAHREVQGPWPEAAALVDTADVVVCHNVLYNVADLVPFASALTDKARHRVVVQVSEDHPTANLNPFWRALHGLERPTSPTGDDALAVLVEMGLDVESEWFERPWSTPGMDRADRIEAVRRRLCVGPDRDAEIDALLGPDLEATVRRSLAVWWPGRG